MRAIEAPLSEMEEFQKLNKYLEKQKPSQAVIDTAYSILLQNAPELLNANQK